jgi:glycosyltransferase involved in cell wall biosynthesis
MPRSRLLVFTENYARGGGNRYCVDLINALSPVFDEIVLAANEGGVFAEDQSRLAANVVVLPAAFVTRSRARHLMRRIPKPGRAPALALLSLAEPLLFRANVALLSRLVRRIGPDVVLSCNGGYPAARAALAMVVAAHRSKVPVVLSVVSVPTPRRKYMIAYDRAIDLAIWRSAKLVIVNAQAIADALSAQHDMPSHLARVIHNGLPDAPLPANDESADAIGFVARLDRAKGVLVLFEAFRQLAQRWPLLKLRLVGHGDASKEISRQARESSLADRVDADGHVTGDINSILASFRVYAFPSFHEGLPYSILEAMRAGCPIVSTAVGGIPEIVRDGSEALLVPPHDADALAAAIDRLLADEGTARRLGRAARDRFERNHLLEKVATKVVTVFVESGMVAMKPTHSGSPERSRA